MRDPNAGEREHSASAGLVGSAAHARESPGLVLSRRALNRALLERQHLLRRVDASGARGGRAPPRAAGAGADAAVLRPLVAARGLRPARAGTDAHRARGGASDADARDGAPGDRRATRSLLRPLVQGVIERGAQRRLRAADGGADPAELAAAVRELLDGEPLTARELGARLVERGIGDDVEAIGNATRVYVPLVQVPPRGVWGAGGQAKYASLEAWTGRELEPSRRSTR